MEQADIWATHNPADLVENLRGIALFVSCGNGHLGPLDPPGTDPAGVLAQLEAALLLHNQEFVARAQQRSIDVTVDFYRPVPPTDLGKPDLEHCRRRADGPTAGGAIVVGVEVPRLTRDQQAHAQCAGGAPLALRSGTNPARLQERPPSPTGVPGCSRFCRAGRRPVGA